MMDREAGQVDQTPQFSIPDRLYGRDQASASLLEGLPLGLEAQAAALGGAGMKKDDVLRH